MWFKSVKYIYIAAPSPEFFSSCKTEMMSFEELFVSTLPQPLASVILLSLLLLIHVSRVRLCATPWTDCSLPDSFVRGIFQARVLDWVAVAFSHFLSLDNLYRGNYTVFVFLWLAYFYDLLGFPGDSDNKESACKARDLGSISGWEDPLEKEMTTHSTILAWRIPWTEEPGVHEVTESDMTEQLSLSLISLVRMSLSVNHVCGMSQDSLLWKGCLSIPPLMDNWLRPPFGHGE